MGIMQDRKINMPCLSIVGHYRIRIKKDIPSDQIICSSDLCHLMLFCDIILIIIVIFCQHAALLISYIKAANGNSFQRDLYE